MVNWVFFGLERSLGMLGLSNFNWFLKLFDIGVIEIWG